MTEKLYYFDSFMKDFTATVISCEKSKTGWEVELDRTAFYPEGGGQPGDWGRLGEATVSDTHERGGRIYHACDRALEVGSEIRGEIDFARRFDFMQQHSGEHIVSGFICKRYGCDNVGFHIGREFVTIDFNVTPDILTPEALREIEYEANEYIWKNYPVEVTTPPPCVLKRLPYRSKKALTGEVRIVEWYGADICACCGTHVDASGQIGIVKLVSSQKFRDGTRIELLAGRRALAQYNVIEEQNKGISKILSAKPNETLKAVERIENERNAAQKKLHEQEEAEFRRKSEQYTGAGNVLLIEGAMPPESVRKLCGMVQLSAGGRCAIFAGADGAYQYAVSDPDADLRGLAKELNTALEGRGGGRGGFIQGSVKAGAERIREFFKTV